MDYTLDAWPGDQAERFQAEAARISAHYPDPDDQYMRDTAMSAALQYLLGEATAKQAREDLVTARVRLVEAMTASQQIAVMLVADGTSEVEAARRCGIDRMTLRKALGK